MTCSSDHLSLSSRHPCEPSWTGWLCHLDSSSVCEFITSSGVCLSSSSTPSFPGLILSHETSSSTDKRSTDYITVNTTVPQTRQRLCSTMMIFNHLFLDNLLWTQWMSFSASVSLFGLLVIYSNLIPEPIKRIFKYGKAADRHVIGMKKLRKIELPKRYVYSVPAFTSFSFPDDRREKRRGTIDPCFTLFLIDLNPDLLEMREWEESATCNWSASSSWRPESSSLKHFSLSHYLVSHFLLLHLHISFQTLYFWPRNHGKRECECVIHRSCRFIQLLFLTNAFWLSNNWSPFADRLFLCRWFYHFYLVATIFYSSLAINVIQVYAFGQQPFISTRLLLDSYAGKERRASGN